MLHAVNASIDLSDHGRRLASYHFANRATPCLVNLRDGGPNGVLYIQLLLPTDGVASMAFGGSAPLFPNGLFVEVPPPATVTGCVDLIEGEEFL